MAALEPLTLTCPIRGVLKPRKRRGSDLSTLEERHRIDAIRHLISLGYDPNKIKIEAAVARFGRDGKNSFRCDLAVLDVDAALVDLAGPNGVQELLQHAVMLAEIKRDDSKADYVRRTQVEPLLQFASRKDTIGLYWDGVTPRVFWKEDDGTKTLIKSGPLALLPRPGRPIKATQLTYTNLRKPESLLDIFSRVENVLHSASVPLDERYEVLLQLILAKIFDEHQGEPAPKEPLAFQDFASVGTSPRQAAKDLNSALSRAVGFYRGHLPRAIEDVFGIPDETIASCGQIMAPHLITAANKEVIQTFYMKFAKDLYRWDLAQYFTPPTVTDFIVEVLNPVSGEVVKDPACGSADFLVATFHRSRGKKIRNAADMTFGADNDAKAVQIAVLNMLLNGDGKTNIKEQDSLLAVASDRERAQTDRRAKPQQFNALVCNPPFGTKIVERRQEVLKWFDLGHDWICDPLTGRWQREGTVLSQQEKGLLFAEVCVHQARPGGRIAIILPNGYLGNRSEKYVAFREWLLRHCRIVSICGFPRFTFKTSGADVSASVVYLEKRESPLSDSALDRDYMVNIELIENVGWSVGDKNALPIFERSEADGSFLVGEDGRKVIHSDFGSVLNDIRTSPASAQFGWLVKGLNMPPASNQPLGWAVPILQIVSDPVKTLDPKRHSRKYTALVLAVSAQDHLRLTEIFDVIPQGKTAEGDSFRKVDDAMYSYIDIDNIGAGDYRTTQLRGWQLPQRGKHLVGPGEVYVGSIWSSVSKWCLIDRKPREGTVVTNGCHRLKIKPGMEARLLDACAFFCSETYTTQMRALARGSDGLAEIHEDDLELVLVPLIKGKEERKRLQPFVDALIDGKATLKGTVASLLAQGALDMPLPAPRPHHSTLV